MSENLELGTSNPSVNTDEVVKPAPLQQPSVKTTSLPEHAQEEQPKKSLFREYFESGVVTLIMALFGMTFIVQAVKVPTGSMKKRDLDSGPPSGQQVHLRTT